jgi:nucleotide-binding universal stress UspA family protein
VVVGVDGSTTSRKALKWANEEARVRGATLTVVHAWHPAMFGVIEFAAPVLDIETFDVAAKRLVEEMLAGSHVDASDPSIETNVVEGGATQAILEAAADASLVVVGSRGRGAVARVLLGSVSQQVVHHAPCPVVIVPG